MCLPGVATLITPPVIREKIIKAPLSRCYSGVHDEPLNDPAVVEPALAESGLSGRGSADERFGYVLIRYVPRWPFDGDRVVVELTIPVPAGMPHHGRVSRRYDTACRNGENERCHREPTCVHALRS